MINDRKSKPTFLLILLILVLLLMAYEGSSQSIERHLIGSAGIYNEAGFTSSVGEVAILTLFENSLTITQGFQQAEMNDEEPPPPPLGLAEADQHILVYPNPIPVNGSFSIETANHSQIELEIRTLDGKRVIRSKNLLTDSQKAAIDLNAIPEGHYLLMLYSTNREKLLDTRKILITKN